MPKQLSKAAHQGREAVPGMLIFPIFLAVVGPYPAGFQPPGAEEGALGVSRAIYSLLQIYSHLCAGINLFTFMHCYKSKHKTFLYRFGVRMRCDCPGLGKIHPCLFSPGNGD